MRRRPCALLALALALLPVLPACQERQTRLRVTFPLDVDAGADGGACEAQTSLRCVNYLQFTAGDHLTEFSSDCVPVNVGLENLCDVAKLADGREVFKLPPHIALPVIVQGLRVYPATGCTGSSACPPKVIFAGETAERGRIGDYAGAVLEIPLTMREPCGAPEEFFPLRPGDTCAQVCRGEIVCQGVEQGCLCKQLPQNPGQSRLETRGY